MASAELVSQKVVNASVEGINELDINKIELDPKTGQTTGDSLKQRLDDLRAMAVVLSTQDKLEEAMGLFQEVLDTRMKSLGPDHIDVAESYFNMITGTTLHHPKKMDESLGRRQKALDIYGKVLLSPDDARVLNIAISCEDISSGGYPLCAEENEDRLEEALVTYQTMFDIFTKAWGEDDPDTMMALYFIGEILCKQDKLEEAEIVLKKFLRWYRPDSSCSAKGREVMDMIREK